MITRATTWTSAVDAQYKLIKHHQRLFEGDHEAAFLANNKKVPFELVIPNLLGECLTEPLADCIFPSQPRVIVKDQENDAVSTLLQEIGWWDLCYPTANRVSYAGQGDWKLVWDSEQKKADLVLWGANDGEFATYDPSGKAVNYWYEVVIERENNHEVFKVCERHELQNNGTEITNTAYGKNLVLGNYYPVKWGSIAEAWTQYGLEQPAEVNFLSGMLMLPGRRLKNVDLDGKETGNSDYTPSRKNIQWRLILIESARNFTTAITTVPEVIIDPNCIGEDGKPNWSDLIFKVRNPMDGDSVAIDIKARVTSLGDSEKVLTQLWDDWAAISPVSPILYGKSVGSDASGESLRLSLMRTIRAVERRRQVYAPATLWAYQCAAMLHQVYQSGTSYPAIDALTLEHAPAIPANLLQESTRIQGEYKTGIRSRRSAISSVNPTFTPQQIDEEEARIKAEDEEKRALAVPSFSMPFGG
jgi:hypothetical protein